MEPSIIYYDKDQFINTATGNKVSRLSILSGAQNIVVTGKTIINENSIIRGDLSSVRIGRYCIVGAGTVLKPSYKRRRNKIAYSPLTIGDHTIIGSDCVIEASSIGTCVEIGKNCIISQGCILKDCCKILDDTVLAPDTVVPPFAAFGGHPGVYVSNLSETTPEVQKEESKNIYDLFQPEPE